MPNLYLQQSDGTPVATFRLYHDFAARAGQEEVVVLGIIPEAASANPAPAGSYTRTDEADWKARAEKAEKERDEARRQLRETATLLEGEQATVKAAHSLILEQNRQIAAEARRLTPETIEAPTITLYRAPDPNHVRVKVEHPAFGVFGEVVHLPNTPATVADDLWVSFSSEEVLIEHPLIGRHARRLDIPVTDKMVERAQKAIAEKSGGNFTPGEVRTYNILAAALTEPPTRPEGAEDIEMLIADQMGGDIDPTAMRALADHLAGSGVRVTEDGAATPRGGAAMTTTIDTDALLERIARALATQDGFGPERPDHEVVTGEWSSVATDVLPIVEAEVRAASEKAWDDCAHEADRRWLIGGRSAAILHDRNPYRATEYETGEQR